MQDQLITFETAKLAKEKGFSIPAHSYYFEDGEFKEYEIKDTYGYYGEEYTVSRSEFYEDWNNKWLTKKSGDRCFGCNKSQGYFETYSAPTQSLLQKWLRETHEIHITLHKGVADKYWYKIFSHLYLGIDNTVESKLYNNYEEALEVGLQEALKLI